MRRAPGSPRGAGCAWLAAGLALAPVLGAVPRPAAAQGLLPPVGADVRTGDLRREFERAFQTQPPAATPGYTITPGIEVLGAWTDAVQQRNGRTSSDFYTAVTPSISASADTRRLQGTLFLAPQLQLYATQGNQNQFNNNLNASGRVMVLEDLLFINLRGYSAIQSRNGGLGPNSTVSLNRQDQVQTQSYTIQPQLRRRFGDIGTAELSYGYTYTTNDSQGTSQAATPFSSYVGDSNLSTTEARGTFTSGEVLGRANATLDVRYADSTGGGTVRNSHRYSQIVDFGYAITRSVRALGSIGHEDIYYKGATVYRNEGLVYSGGAQWTPDPDTSIQAQYGHRDGSTGFSFDGTYAATARTRVALRYSQGIGSEQEDLQNTLANSTTTAGGVPIDIRTGLPLSATNNFFGTQGNIYRTERLSGSVTVLMERNVVTVELRRDDRVLVAQGATAVAGNPQAQRQTGTFGSVTFQRELSDALTATLFGQYGVRNTPGIGNQAGADQDSFTGTASVSYTISRTLVSRALYSYTSGQNSGFSGQQGRAQNLFLVSLSKTF